MSVEVSGKDEGGVTLPILKVGRPIAVEKEFRIVSKGARLLTVFDSGDKYALR